MRNVTQRVEGGWQEAAPAGAPLAGEDPAYCPTSTTTQTTSRHRTLRTSSHAARNIDILSCSVCTGGHSVYLLRARRHRPGCASSFRHHRLNDFGQHSDGIMRGLGSSHLSRTSTTGLRRDPLGSARQSGWACPSMPHPATQRWLERRGVGWSAVGCSSLTRGCRVAGSSDAPQRYFDNLYQQRLMRGPRLLRARPAAGKRSNTPKNYSRS